MRGWALGIGLGFILLAAPLEAQPLNFPESLGCWSPLGALD
jgi:hypothetical protein